MKRVSCTLWLGSTSLQWPLEVKEGGRRGRVQEGHVMTETGSDRWDQRNSPLATAGAEGGGRGRELRNAGSV